MKALKRIASASLLAVTLFGGLAVMSGCNTAHGAGKDMERAGEKVQDATH